MARPARNNTSGIVQPAIGNAGNADGNSTGGGFAGGLDSGASAGAGTVIDPACIPVPGSDGPGGGPDAKPERRKPGRKPGQKYNTPKATVHLGDANFKDMVATSLFQIHLGLAMLTKRNEWMLQESEAENIGKAVSDVAAYYPDAIPSSGKVMAWANLGIVALGVYGTRIAAIKMADRAKDATPVAGGFSLG